MIKISNICLHQNSIFITFLKTLKIHEIFCENPRIIFVLFYDVHKENMFTINLEDGREAPSKASINTFKKLFLASFMQFYSKKERKLPFLKTLSVSFSFSIVIFSSKTFVPFTERCPALQNTRAGQGLTFSRYLFL